MKKITVVFGLLLIINVGNAQINSYVQYLTDYYNVDFELTIKKHAFDEYRNNQAMRVIEANEQAESLFEIVEIYNLKNKDFLFEAIDEWTYDDYEIKNERILKTLNKVSVPVLLKLHCNWVNVLDEYKHLIKQKAKHHE